MNKPITVKILVTVNDPEHFDACTLCFETLRVGWPTAQIHIYSNGNGTDSFQSIVGKFIRCFEGDKNVFFKPITSTHHAEWIHRHVGVGYPGPLVIVDPDTVFWKSCEDWNFLDDTLLAGYYVPRMWNDFAKCVSAQRIHTSMMVFPDTMKLRNALGTIYPWCFQPHGDYCPCDPFSPKVAFETGVPTFWDSCSNLYNMLLSIRGNGRLWPAIEHFRREQLECFDHLNSASFRDVMAQRMSASHSANFLMAHRDWVANPVPGLWPLVDAYYEQKRIEGAVLL